MDKNNMGINNTGELNSGDFNSGDFNSGDFNSGNKNSGNWNSGNWNSGNRNSGNWNSGNWNSGDWNSGYFNTDEPDYVRVFNKWVEMTPSEFWKKYKVYADIPLNRWVHEGDMTDEEKSEVEGWKKRGGYLKTLDFKEACQIWWKENPDRHDDFLNLPGFDASMFKEITGIDVNEEDEVDITVEGKTKRISRKSAKALGLLN